MSNYEYDNPDDAYKEAQRRIKKAKGKSATRLSLNRLGLTAVPPEIGQLTGLTLLDLSGNQLTVVPPEIGQLTGLTLLRLDGNQLTAVQPKIGQLTELIDIYLGDNQLTAIPPEIGQLTGLMVLHLGNNKLTSVPPEIGQLTGLRRLFLHKNQLTAIPPEIGQLTGLTALVLSDNQLTAVPSEITQLTKLEQLYLQDNPDLPIPPEIIAQKNNAQAILDYIRENQEAPSSPLNEAKLILVGQGGVGKTSLVKRLLHNKFNEAENQTKGINIEKWSLPVERPQQGTVPITLNIWDFGGQEIMHATHQFFLTKRSLYLLVLDARAGEEESRVEYWLALINSFAPAAPVLIIINKSDQHHLDINRRGLQEKHPAIAGFVSTSASTGKGISQLQVAIATTLATMPDIDSAFPASWMRVKKALVAMQEDFLPYDEYEKLCTSNGVEEESSQTTLIHFLHDLGIVLNFNDDDRVRDTSVLNPNWVTDGIYKLLNNKELQKAHGLLPRNLLRNILPRKEYPSQQRRFLLDMMLKFELAFALPDRQTLLIPDLISKSQPAFNWNDDDALQFAYQYDVLPRSVLHRFMVRQNHLIHPTNRWRTGMMLQLGNLTALIKADIKAATIHISIIEDVSDASHLQSDGHLDRRQFLYTLRLTFADIHASISGTKPEEVVPIPNYPDAPPVSYAYLEKLEAMNAPDSQLFPKTDKFLSIQDLLNGVSTAAMRQAGIPTRQEILATLNKHFSEDDFDALLFDLDIDPDEFTGTIGNKMRNFIRYMERNGKLGELVELLREKRPNAEL